MELILQIALVAAMVAYLWQRHVDLNQCNRETGDHLLARVKAEMGTKDFKESATWLGLQAVGGDRGASRDWREHWTLYKRAGLLMRMADHADLAAGVKALDASMILSLRRDAMQVRISALTAIAGCAFQR
jgi:hypothetical protein